jgi:hypothetical protein
VAGAGRTALHQLAPAVSEDAVYILVGEIVKALDNGKGRRGAAELAGALATHHPSPTQLQSLLSTAPDSHVVVGFTFVGFKSAMDRYKLASLSAKLVALE